ncbi:Sugar phosphate permease [Noviherbaspirillum humi]|uniref:Sugar phosphate permease n=1 Tax=Noviherbaspirillum humi TaxID=1688639 RepID=A0A239D6V4_9BURK|nr:MFS transporter [Noviherbaspirillum humi]SNS28017.1 Sugar phosphate permease [Noviherbaspirillum humi]
MNQIAAPTLRQDAQVIGLVGLAHSVSHFFHLILAPLFPWLKPAFGLSYAELGFAMTMFYVVSGTGQVLAGFVVDRIGARRVLLGGLAFMGIAAVILSQAQNYAMLIAGSMLAGLGNSVFHPADFTILNQRVSAPRLGHAFSVHGITGNLGWAAAPVFLLAVNGMADWRTALLAAACIPFAVLALLFLHGDVLEGVGRRTSAGVAPAGEAGPHALAFLKVPGVWMCFGFFFITALALGGIQSFATPSLRNLYGMSLPLAADCFTAYMLCSALGTICGGFIASRAARHERTIAIAFISAGLISMLVASAALPPAVVLILMGAIGFGSGVAGPSRDLLIRSTAPKNATGRVYGVVYSGLDVGMMLAPLMFGAFMDAGRHAWVFFAIGFFQILAISTAVGIGARADRAPARPQAA